MSIKQRLMNRARKLLEDPRVASFIESPLLMQSVESAIEARAKLQENLEQGVQRIAKRLNLATTGEVREMKRTIRRLEREVYAQQAEQSARDDRAAQ